MKAGDIVLGKYRAERVLGQGGMGVVIAIRHTELDELFAMKLMKPKALAQPAAFERFLREARAAAKLRSDHAARVYDVGRLPPKGDEPGTPYMLMEYLSGCDLRTLLATHGCYSASEVVAFLLQALDAVTEAHSMGIVHRDLKPENLFIARRANKSTSLKVLDFGISKEMGPAVLATPQTTSNMLGSPYYMSPEQMRSPKDVDARADIWALGVISYELLTDRVPFQGETVTEVCAAVLEGDPPPISAFAPNTPQALVDVIARCLSRKREGRYPSAEDLSRALQRVARELGTPERLSLPGALLPSVPPSAPSRRPGGTSQVFAAIKLRKIADPRRTTAGGSDGDHPTGPVQEVPTPVVAAAVVEPIPSEPQRNPTETPVMPEIPCAPPVGELNATPIPTSLGPTIQGWSERPTSTVERPRSRRNIGFAVGAGALAVAGLMFFLVNRSAASHDNRSEPASPSKSGDGNVAPQDGATNQASEPTSRSMVDPASVARTPPTGEAVAPAAKSAVAVGGEATQNGTRGAAGASTNAQPPPQATMKPTPTAVAVAPAAAGPSATATPQTPKHEGIY